MRAQKLLCVIAYDIADTRRRNRIVKILQPYGRRINYSVFECMFTPSQFSKIRLCIERIAVKGKDSVAIYPICVNCYARAVYLPGRKDEFKIAPVFE